MKKYSVFLFLLLSMAHSISFASAFTLESPAFKLNTMIPVQYTCNGTDKSPPLTWHNAPAKTQSFVLIVQDPDAPNGIWTHWILFNIPSTVTKLDTGAMLPDGAANGKNSWDNLDYHGPCPPLGAHRYIFKLYAMDNILSEENGANADRVLSAMTGHVLDSAELVGLYQK